MKVLDLAGAQRLWNSIRTLVLSSATGTSYLASDDPNVIVTHKFTAGQADTALACRYGANNIVRGFVSGEDSVFVPMALLSELNPDTTLSAGTLPAGRFDTAAAGADMLFYDGNGVLHYCATATDAHAILTLAGAPTLAAADITIG